MTVPQRFRSDLTGREVRAVLFDTFGTVVDWRSGVAAALAEFADRLHIDLDAEPFADLWRTEYQPSMEPIRNGTRDFVTLDVLHRESLERLLKRNGLSPSAFAASELEWLTFSWHRLPPWPDAIPGLRALKADYIIGPLSNGNTSLLLEMAKNAGLPWDVIIGSDLTRAYKPHPDAYLRTAAVLDLDPGELMLAAAHNSDLRAAQTAGLATAFIHRPTERGPNQQIDLAATGDWDVVADDIVDLAKKLGPTRDV